MKKKITTKESDLSAGNRHVGRGFFLEPPTVFQRQGRWHLQLPRVFHDSDSSDSASCMSAQLCLCRCNSFFKLGDDTWICCVASAVDETPFEWNNHGIKLCYWFSSVDTIEAGWKSRDEIFDICRDSTPLANLYIRSINQQLAAAVREENNVPAALIIEPGGTSLMLGYLFGEIVWKMFLSDFIVYYPRSDISMWYVSGTVMHGAGGMDMIDPLYQRMLVRECRRRGIPTIFDEVLSGCWRFGVEVCVLLCLFVFIGYRLHIWIHTPEGLFLISLYWYCQSAVDLLGCSPDIACYSKLLSGGLVPLAATLATQAVFEAFRGISKVGFNFLLWNLSPWYFTLVMFDFTGHCASFLATT